MARVRVTVVAGANPGVSASGFLLGPTGGRMERGTAAWWPLPAADVEGAGADTPPAAVRRDRLPRVADALFLLDFFATTRPRW